jgi:hypothetical protein
VLTLFAGQAVTSLSTKQMERLVYASRKKEYGDWKELILQHPICSVSDTDKRFFVQFDVTANYVEESKDILISWGSVILI